VDALGATEWINVAITMAGAGSVYIATNLEDGSVWTYTKAIFSGGTAGLTLLISFINDGSVTGAEWTQVAAAGLATLAVALVSNDVAADVSTGRHRVAG
jgi:hypothetical protein